MSEMNSGHNKGKKGPVLLAEDNEGDAQLFRLAFEELGVANKLIICKDGQEALEYLKTGKETPFLIFSDINMPRMTGVELKQEILKTEFLRKKVVPFIFLTSSSEHDDVESAFIEHAQGYFEKSFDTQRLKDNLKATFEYWNRNEVPDDRE